jgi:hypothetical protein
MEDLIAAAKNSSTAPERRGTGNKMDDLREEGKGGVLFLRLCPGYLFMLLFLI